MSDPHRMFFLFSLVAHIFSRECNECVSKYSNVNISLGSVAMSHREICSEDVECMRIMPKFLEEATKQVNGISARDLCEIEGKCRAKIAKAELLADDCGKCKDILHYYGTDGRDRTAKILSQLFDISCKRLQISPEMCSSVNDESAAKFIDLVGARMDETSICRGTGICKNDAKISRTWP